MGRAAVYISDSFVLNERDYFTRIVSRSVIAHQNFYIPVSLRQYALHNLQQQRGAVVSWDNNGYQTGHSFFQGDEKTIGVLKEKASMTF
jgi:hypothetical protein